MDWKIETLSEHKCFGGTVGFYKHWSHATQCDMRFSAFVPGGKGAGPFPVLTYLAGLTCTEETFMIKGGALQGAAEQGLMLVAPDTSPRGLNLPGEEDDWDFGTGAGFYLDATEAPWADHYNMYSYVVRDLQKAVCDNFPADPCRQGIFGHSMGGHGALTIGLKHPEIYKSISAFAPIATPMQCPWGQKAFSNYLGPDRESWRAYDATEIIKRSVSAACPKILIDQGLNDPFLERELHPHLFEQVCAEAGQRLNLRRREKYDHGYYFISTFMTEHLAHHLEYIR